MTLAHRPSSAHDPPVGTEGRSHAWTPVAMVIAVLAIIVSACAPAGPTGSLPALFPVPSPTPVPVTTPLVTPSPSLRPGAGLGCGEPIGRAEEIVLVDVDADRSTLVVDGISPDGTRPC
jgi:hypothetical protein